MNYQMPINGQNPNMMPFQNFPSFQNNPNMLGQNPNMMPFMPNNSVQMGGSLSERIDMLEQKMQSVENRLKKLEKGNVQEEINDGFYQYKTSMHMM